MKEGSSANFLPRLWIYLSELQLMSDYNLSIIVEDEESRAGGTLVDRSNKR